MTFPCCCNCVPVLVKAGGGVRSDNCPTTLKTGRGGVGGGWVAITAAIPITPAVVIKPSQAFWLREIQKRLMIGGAIEEFQVAT